MNDSYFSHAERTGRMTKAQRDRLWAELKGAECPPPPGPDVAHGTLPPMDDPTTSAIREGLDAHVLGMTVVEE